jgi:tRNA G37 N-methylase Trm5
MCRNFIEHGANSFITVSLDLGDLCVWCRESTACGSGKFVNRYPVYGADDEQTIYHESKIRFEVDGYCCADCESEWEAGE